MFMMSDGGGGGTSPTAATVPLMIQPEALVSSAVRFEAIAETLESWMVQNGDRLAPQPAGNDEVSTFAAVRFAAQGLSATAEISASVVQLRQAAENCRKSAQQYQQTDVLPT